MRLSAWFLLAIVWCVVAVIWPLPAAANDDFIIILDQSWSMLEKQPGIPSGGYYELPSQAQKSREAIEALEFILEQLLKEGDYFALIIFGDRAEVSISQTLGYKHERDLIKRHIHKLPFKDKRTDIIAGIKRAGDLLESLNTPKRRKIMILITDGVNDPPADSPYLSPAQQQQSLQRLRDTIRFNKWNVNLFGLGAQTGVTDLAKKLDMSPDEVFTIDDFKSGIIKERLISHIRDTRESEVKVDRSALKVRLEPRLFGGYKRSEITLTLLSSFEKNVAVSLQTTTPVVLEGATGVRLNVTPLALKLPPKQPGQLTVSVSLDARRPEDGRLVSSYAFAFAEGSVPFYPQEGTIEVIVPSWWESYGAFAIVAMLVVLLGAAWTAWLVRRAQVPEIRIGVTAGTSLLGEPMTVHKGERFSIANNQFARHTVPARGLACNTAATVRYLGRRKFEVVPDEATLMQANNKVERLTIGLDDPFDLQDSEGKTLRDMMISSARRAGDIFGAGHDTGLG